MSKVSFGEMIEGAERITKVVPVAENVVNVAFSAAEKALGGNKDIVLSDSNEVSVPQGRASNAGKYEGRA
ncbi:MAG: hypothetical protein R3D71_08935 [Rickettsiales bacterium]